MKFFIVVPVFNAEAWIEECIKSIQAQSEPDFSCLVCDDASTDRTGAILDALPLDSRFQVLHRTNNEGPLASAWHGFQVLNTRSRPDSILTVIDGDDRLAHRRVLEHVAGVYAKNPECLLTYGNFVIEPGELKSNCEEFPGEVVRSREYRKHKFVSSHLRTFKSILWNNILEDDLKDPTTKRFLQTGGDVAFMIPMLEMAGSRFRFIPDILYIYNSSNPLSDDKVRLAEQSRVAALVKGMPKYPLLRGKTIPRVRFALKRMLLGNPIIWRTLLWRNAVVRRRGGREGK